VTISEILNSANIAKIDAELLLAHSMGKSREWLIINPNEELSHLQHATFNQYAEHRKNHKPIAYITRTKEFYGREFIVSPDVLIPRPATEGLIDLTLDFLKSGTEEVREVDTDIVVVTKRFGDISDASTIVDLGTGSGCIAITLALETDKNIIATDISTEALDIAKQNAKKHGAEDRIAFQEHDLQEELKDIKQPYIIVSNPPYIPDNEELMPDVADFEPHLALFGGPVGDSCVVKIYNSHLRNPLCRGIALECRKEQALGIED
tara:strand:+ start:341 stop:1132 length:792 start_codon:yes stop_codon:yes gene_type:complete